MQDDLATIAKDTRRVAKDIRAALSAVQHQITRIGQGTDTAAPRPGRPIARAAMAVLLREHEDDPFEDVARKLFSPDAANTIMVLRAATAPALITTVGWAAELMQVAVSDFIDDMARITAFACRFT
jgi:hypothetical protein